MGVFTVYCLLFPDREVRVDPSIVLRFWRLLTVCSVVMHQLLYCTHPQLKLYGFYDITAADALKLTTAMNLVGSAFQRNLSIDCVGHIGGQTTGLVLNETSMLA